MWGQMIYNIQQSIPSKSSKQQNKTLQKNTKCTDQHISNDTLLNNLWDQH